MSSSSSSSSTGHVYQGYLSSASSSAGGDEPIDWPDYLPSTHELAAAAAMGAGAGEEEEEEAAPWALEFVVPAVSGLRGRRLDHGRGMDPMAVCLLGKLGADGKDYNNYEWERCNNGVPGGSSSFSMMQQEELVGEEAPPPLPAAADPVQRPFVELGFDLNLPAPEAVGFEFDLNEPAPEAVAAAAADKEEEEEENDDPAPAAN